MRLTKVGLKNFRLLAEVSVSLHDTTTVLVGPNNSGKTSMAEALQLFVDGSAKDFSISDFSVTTHATFAAAEKAMRDRTKPVAGQTGSTAPPVGDSGTGAPPPDPDTAAPVTLPSISMTVEFTYQDTPEDLAAAWDVLMDLSEQSRSVAVHAEFAVRDVGQLEADYCARCATASLSLIEFLSERLSNYYALAFYKSGPGGTTREVLSDRGPLNRLLKVDFLPAQRHMEDQEGSQATRLSRLLNAHYEKRHKAANPASYDELERAVRAQSTDLTGRYAAAFGGLKDSLLQFGYPQTPNLTIKAELTASTLFKDNTRVYYGAELDEPAIDGVRQTYDLPERSNGLGFKNLIYMVLQLKGFRDELEGHDGPRPRVHLIIVEEPEAHLHPQMQSVFIAKAWSFISASRDAGVQLLLTTHSSHIVADCGLAPIRYFRRKGARICVKDLVEFELSRKEPEQQTALRFLTQYLTLTRCDLFFCDKAILIEGATERLLLPKMMSKTATGDGDLTRSYVAVIEVGGTYAHSFKDLLHFIDVPTLVITDLDSIGSDRKKCAVSAGVSTSNAVLTKWLPGTDKLAEILQATEAKKTDGRVRVAYQVPEQEDAPCARSFEEAFVYANADWLVLTKSKLVATNSLIDDETAALLRARAFDLVLPKVDFALDLIVNDGWSTPRYIADGLRWLAREQP